MKSTTLLGSLFSLGVFAGCLAGSGGGGGPRVCLPDSEVQAEPAERDPECEACVRNSCAPRSDCDDPCASYYACTCECDGDDTACFAACGDERTPSCEQCTNAASEELLACVQAECADTCLGGIGGADDGGWSAGDDAADDGGWSAGDDAADDGGWSAGDDGASPGAACDELHGSCCPSLEGVDRELCDGASDEAACEIWLDIFRSEGAC